MTPERFSAAELRAFHPKLQRLVDLADRLERAEPLNDAEQKEHANLSAWWAGIVRLPQYGQMIFDGAVVAMEDPDRAAAFARSAAIVERRRQVNAKKRTERSGMAPDPPDSDRDDEQQDGDDRSPDRDPCRH